MPRWLDFAVCWAFTEISCNAEEGPDDTTELGLFRCSEHIYRGPYNSSAEWPGSWDDPRRDGSMTTVFNDTRSREDTGIIVTQAWVFLVHAAANYEISGKSLENFKRVIEELFVALYTLIHVGRTRRKILILLTNAMPAETMERIRVTGCCEVRLIQMRCFSDKFNTVAGKECDSAQDAGRTVFEIFRLYEFEKVVYLNADIQFVNPGVDAIFDFPNPGMHMAGVPGGHVKILPAGDMQGATGGPRRRQSQVCDLERQSDDVFGTFASEITGHINLGMLVLRPSNGLYHFIDMMLRCYPWAAGGGSDAEACLSRPQGCWLQQMNEQIVINQAASIMAHQKEWMPRASRAHFRFHCIPQVFNCQTWDLELCTEVHAPTVYIRHFAGDQKPLLNDLQLLVRQLSMHGVGNRSYFKANGYSTVEEYINGLWGYLEAYDAMQTWAPGLKR